MLTHALAAPPCSRQPSCQAGHNSQFTTGQRAAAGRDKCQATPLLTCHKQSGLLCNLHQATLQISLQWDAIEHVSAHTRSECAAVGRGGCEAAHVVLVST